MRINTAYALSTLASFAVFCFGGCTHRILERDDDEILSLKQLPKRKPAPQADSKLEVEKKLNAQWIAKEALVRTWLNRERVTASELAKWAQFKNRGESGSLDEAVATIITLRQCLQENKTEDAKDKKEELCNLRQIAQAHEVDLRQAFASNIYLKNFLAHTLLNTAIRASVERDEEFGNDMYTLIRKATEEWVNLDQVLKQKEADVSITEQAPQSAQANSDTPAAALTYDNYELQKEEEPLIKATELIQQGKFQEVVDLLRQVPSTHMYYSAAQEKLKEACNLAVQNLRRDAAKAFQSAMPVTDRQARLGYLTSARNYLKEAIDYYPEADQIETVQQNLKVIEKNIDAITISKKAD